MLGIGSKLISKTKISLSNPKTKHSHVLKFRESSNIFFQQQQTRKFSSFSQSKYPETYEYSLRNPDQFWAAQAENIHWFKKYDKVFEKNTKINNGWFHGGELNVSYNALDRHLKSSGNKNALIYDSPVTNKIIHYSYNELHSLVTQFAGVLREMGVGKGDRVIIYNPVIPQTIIAMLACARIGAIHSVVFGGFAADELATRIEDAEPKLIVSASCGIEGGKVIDYKQLLDHALEISKHKVPKCVIYQREMHKVPLKQGRDFSWDEIMKHKSIKPVNEAISLPSDHPLYILYTSGTTGKPKGVVRDTGGYSVALNWSMDAIFGMKKDDVWWAASDLGWVVGHSYILYGPLLKGCTTVMYEGKPVGTPDCGSFWRVIQQHKVNSMFVAPTAFRAIKKEDPNGEELKKYKIHPHFKTLFLAGERSDPPTVHWASDLLKTPIVDNWWMTETGWPITSNFIGLGAIKQPVGSGGRPVPGYDLKVLDHDGNPLPPTHEGALAVKLPLPPGALLTLWKNHERYVESYVTQYPGYFSTGDSGFIDDDGNVHILSRTDDVIKVAGHRLGTGSIEEVVASHPSVAECAVFGVTDEIKGEVPMGLIVLKSGISAISQNPIPEIVALVREKLGPVYAFRAVLIVQRLPKTRSGKILRSTVKKLANGDPFKTPATIDDPKILDELKEILKEAGYPKKSLFK